VLNAGVAKKRPHYHTINLPAAGKCHTFDACGLNTNGTYSGWCSTIIVRLVVQTQAVIRDQLLQHGYAFSIDLHTVETVSSSQLSESSPHSICPLPRPRFET